MRTSNDTHTHTHTHTHTRGKRRDEEIVEKEKQTCEREK
jgi:hypothetical protein